MKIGVIGLWHLGCVLCAAWSKLGHEVVGYDPDADRVDGLKEGKPPLFEPDLAETIEDSMGKGLLSFSTDADALGDCDFVFLSYDTPVLDDDSSDTSILTESVNTVSGSMKDGAVLVVSSQSPVGFCAELRAMLKAANNTLDLAYSPENLRLGEAIACYLEPGRIVIGTAEGNTEKKCRELFGGIQGEILAMNIESAEMVKHGINSFLSTSIVFANQLADICETSGANIDDVVRGMKSDPRIGSKAYLAPGIGFSGGTLGRDLKVLEEKDRIAGGDAKLFGKVHEFNTARKNTIVKRIGIILDGLQDKKILLLGATYKPGTSTLRRSLPLEIAGLLADGGAYVSIFDPKADFTEYNGECSFEVAGTIDDGAKDADLLVLLTDWPEFREHDWNGTAGIVRRKSFYDVKNFLDEEDMRKAGFEYYSVGRS